MNIPNPLKNITHLPLVGGFFRQYTGKQCVMKIVAQEVVNVVSQLQRGPHFGGRLDVSTDDLMRIANAFNNDGLVEALSERFTCGNVLKTTAYAKRQVYSSHNQTGWHRLPRLNIICALVAMSVLMETELCKDPRITVDNICEAVAKVTPERLSFWFSIYYESIDDAAKATSKLDSVMDNPMKDQGKTMEYFIEYYTTLVQVWHAKTIGANNGTLITDLTNKLVKLEQNSSVDIDEAKKLVAQLTQKARLHASSNAQALAAGTTAPGMGVVGNTV